jgi:hypothetical protein
MNLRVLLPVILLHGYLTCFGQIVADHKVVDRYSDIPQQYIDAVKKMLVDIAGESHSLGYRTGLNLLELLDARFQVMTYDGPPPAYSNQYLRLGRHGEVGEAAFYTSSSAVTAYKGQISAQNNSGNPYSVIGFGWCWDMTWTNPPGGGMDPVHNVHWAGSSEGGPDGNLRWGLDSGDKVLTGNSVSMDTYLDAVEQYIKHCNDNGYSTRVIFTTGPVDEDGGTETGFQRELKHNYIRDHVSGNTSRILFDYADILSWNNNGQKYIADWNDGGTIRQHANIHPDNLMDYDNSWNVVPISEDGDHIGEVGALRLAKAMWWMLARIAGWDGVTTGTEDIEPETTKIWTEVQGGELRIHLPEDIFFLNKADLYALDGRVIASGYYSGQIFSINISTLPSGLYILIVQHPTGTESKKVLIP